LMSMGMGPRYGAVSAGVLQGSDSCRCRYISNRATRILEGSQVRAAPAFATVGVACRSREERIRWLRWELCTSRRRLRP
jgi:hypothetical protein